MGEESVFPGDMTEENPSLKRDRLCIEEEEEEEELYSKKKQAKEASNDDINSEVVDITSHAAQSSSGGRVGCCSGSDSGSNETVSGGVIASSFVMEIPKHLSTTGITRITFKLSKPPKEEALCHLPMTQERASKKKVSDFVSNVKELLLTGILDGARVKYISNSPLVSLFPYV